MSHTDISSSPTQTCRICQESATPLFHPCKCNGSIKFVHQECLQEWFLRSRKKHCDLCRTPICFTKVYSRDMPRWLPAHVLAKQTAQYLFLNFPIWLCALFAANMWVWGLPLLVRTAWSFSFRVSDEWLGGSLLAVQSEYAARETLALFQCPASPLLRKTTTNLADIATAKALSGGMGAMESNLPFIEEIHFLLSKATSLHISMSNSTINEVIVHIFEGQIILVVVDFCLKQIEIPILLWFGCTVEEATIGPIPGGVGLKKAKRLLIRPWYYGGRTFLVLFACVLLPYNVGCFIAWLTAAAGVREYLHETYIVFQGHIAGSVHAFEAVSGAFSTHHIRLLTRNALNVLQVVVFFSSRLLSSGTWDIHLDNSINRLRSILVGYATLTTIAAVCVRRHKTFLTWPLMEVWWASLNSAIYHVGSIVRATYMLKAQPLLVPLYYGIVLDLALLPLFSCVTVLPRLMLTQKYPTTSILLHWVVGYIYDYLADTTLSDCMANGRRGILHFFHRTTIYQHRTGTLAVTERNHLVILLHTSIIVCMGGLVRWFSFALPSVLPIHYSLNEPSLASPVDCLFLIPLAMETVQGGIYAVYTWWFRRCSRALRLTCFLFGDRRIDEEGDYQPPEGRNILSTFFLVIMGDPETETPTFDPEAISACKRRLVDSKKLLPNGRFVRAPASESHFPRGCKVFIPVDEANRRLDGAEDNDLYSSDLYCPVYLPPSFRFRIILFALFVWVFTIIIGAALIICPLVVGRMVFLVLIPDYLRMNDIYAFSVGTSLFAIFSYMALHNHSLVNKGQRLVAITRNAIADKQARSHIIKAALSGLQLGSIRFYYAVFPPLLIISVVELYVFAPLSTYPAVAAAATITAGATEHMSPGMFFVRLTQAWKIGVLYLKLGSEIFARIFPGSRVTERGAWLYVHPCAFFHAFAVSGAIYALNIVATGLLGYQVVRLLPSELDASGERAVLHTFYEYFCPAAAVMGGLVLLANGLKQWLAWVREEAYSSRVLLNFGAATEDSESRAPEYV